MSMHDNLMKAMADLNEDEVLKCVKAMLDDGYTRNSVIMCLNIGSAVIGHQFEKGEYFIADLIVSGMIYRNALQLLTPRSNDRRSLPIGRVVIGVVEGDIHDIGKDIVVSLLRAERFEVIDLGVDVRPDRFAYAVRTYLPDVLLLSGVLTVAQTSMKNTVDLLKEEGLREQVPILIGGRCTSEIQRKIIGADSWAYDTTETVNFCKRVVEEKYGKTGKSGK